MTTPRSVHAMGWATYISTLILLGVTLVVHFHCNGGPAFVPFGAVDWKSEIRRPDGQKCWTWTPQVCKSYRGFAVERTVVASNRLVDKVSRQRVHIPGIPRSIAPTTK